ncbi:MAG: ArnT family glycosyltransferase [Acidimicrobiales bacterium]
MDGDDGGGASDRRRSSGHRFTVALLTVTAVGSVLRVGYVLTIGRHLTLGFDAVWYELQAGTIATGKGYVQPDAYYRLGLQVPTATFPPLWPFVLGVAHRIGFGSQTDLQLVGAIVGTVTVGLTGLLGRRVAGVRVGVVAALVVACCPMLIAADGSLMSESLYVLLVTAALLASYRAIDRPTLGRFAVVGLLVGLAALARADGLFLAPILAGVLAWRVRGPSTGRRLALAAGTLAVAGAVLAPWVVSRSTQMGSIVALSSNSGSMLAGANCPTAYAGRLLGAWDFDCTVRPGQADLTELEVASASRRAGIDYARDHPSRLPLVVPARVLRVWGLWSPVDATRLESVESRNERWQYVGWAYDLVVMIVAVPGAVLLVRRRADLAPMVAVLLAVVVTAVLSYGNQRFRLSAEPVVAVLAATALVAVAGQVRRTSMRATSPSRSR